MCNTVISTQELKAKVKTLPHEHLNWECIFLSMGFKSCTYHKKIMVSNFMDLHLLPNKPLYIRLHDHHSNHTNSSFKPIFVLFMMHLQYLVVKMYFYVQHKFYHWIFIIRNPIKDSVENLTTLFNIKFNNDVRNSDLDFISTTTSRSVPIIAIPSQSYKIGYIMCLHNTKSRIQLEDIKKLKASCT